MLKNTRTYIRGTHYGDLKILAEVVYLTKVEPVIVIWRAIVTECSALKLGNSVDEWDALKEPYKKFSLFIYHAGTDDFGWAGDYFTAKAVTKYIREVTQNKYPDTTPDINTLNDLEKRSSCSVVPTCYGLKQDAMDCLIANCPYAESCNKLMGSAEIKEVEAESEVDFMARLKQKINSKQWEK